MIIMNLIIVQIIVLLLLLFFKMPLFLLFTIWTHNILQNLFSVSNFLCLFISLLISLYPTAVTFKLSTDFRQTFEKEKKKEIKIKSPLLLVPFRVVNCHSLLFCASHFLILCLNQSFCNVCHPVQCLHLSCFCFISLILSQLFWLFSWSYRSFSMICSLSICPVLLPFTLYLNLLLCLLSLFSSLLSVCAGTVC